MVWLAYIAMLIVIVAAARWAFFSSSSQLFGRFPYKVDTTERIIALTFDDGPNEPYTSQLLEYLASKQIRATFFQVGACVERYPDLTARMAAAGHVIGNHSWSHEFHKYLTQPGFEDEIQQTQTILHARLGRYPALFRPPWLFRQPFLLKRLKDMHLQPVSGTFCHTWEAFQPSAERIARRALAKAKPGAILIFHDGFDGHGGNRSQTVQAVKIVVDALLEDGYTFVTVDELLQVPAYM